MPKSVPALMTPDLLVWARETAGYSLAAAADKLGISAERLAAWERGADQPTFPKLRDMGQLYKRPVAVFYLPERPKTFSPARLHDFRRLPGDTPMTSPQLLFEIRRARARRGQALDLAAQLGINPAEFTLSANIGDDPEDFAESIRTFLGVTVEAQAVWSGHYEHLNGWRGAIEDHGILAFQVSRIETAEMRAFSIAEFPMPVVAVNSKDTVNGRVFSLLHEVCHLALRQEGLCIPRPGGSGARADQDVEAFCNRVAGVALVPRQPLLADPVIKAKPGEVEWTEADLDRVSRRFGASREVVLRRLLTLGRTSQAHYNRMRRLFQTQLEQTPPRESRGGPSQDVVALARAGTLFTRLALEGYHQGALTLSDLSDLLEVKVRFLPEIEEAARKKPVSLP